MNLNYQKAYVLAAILKDEVDEARRLLKWADPYVTCAAGARFDLLERLAKRYSTTELTDMTQATFLQLCGL